MIPTTGSATGTLNIIAKAATSSIFVLLLHQRKPGVRRAALHLAECGTGFRYQAATYGNYATGTMTMKDGNTVIDVQGLTAVYATASETNYPVTLATALNAGVHNLTVTYSGDGENQSFGIAPVYGHRHPGRHRPHARESDLDLHRKPDICDGDHDPGGDSCHVHAYTGTAGTTYGPTSAAPTAAGTYSVSASPTSANYSATATGTMVINKAAATVSVSIGEPDLHGLGNSCDSHHVTRRAELLGDVHRRSSHRLPDQFDGAGECRYVFGRSHDHRPDHTGSGTGTMTISPAPVSISLGGLSTTYNGSVQSVTTLASPPVPLAVSYTAQASTLLGSSMGLKWYPPGYNDALSGLRHENRQFHLYEYAGCACFSGILSAKVNDTSIEVDAATNGVTLNYSGFDGLVFTSSVRISSVTVASITWGVVRCFENQLDSGHIYLNFAQLHTAPGQSISVIVNVNTGPRANAGSYQVVAAPLSPNYSGAATGTLVIARRPAVISETISTLSQTYNGSGHAVTVNTTPAGLSYSLTYAGSTTPPVGAGTYAVAATITDRTTQVPLSDSWSSRKHRPLSPWAGSRGSGPDRLCLPARLPCPPALVWCSPTRVRPPLPRTRALTPLSEPSAMPTTPARVRER